MCSRSVIATRLGRGRSFAKAVEGRVIIFGNYSSLGFDVELLMMRLNDSRGVY